MSDASSTPEQAEIRRLQDEVARLQGASTRPKGHWVRTFWSTVLIVIACLLAPLSVVSVWARGEVTDTNRYVATVAPLASDPAIQDAAATRITNAILAQIDLTALTQQAVGAISSNRNLTPEQTAALTALSGPLVSGIEGYTNDVVTKVVQSDQFAALWVEANTAAHQRLEAALSGQNTDNAIQVQNNQVVLDLSNLLTQVKQRLLDRGFTLAEKIPTSTDATIVLFEAPNATAMQTAYSTLNTVGFWLPLLAVLLAIIGVFISHTPRKALTWLGFGLMLAMLAAAGALAVGRMSYLNALPDTVNQAAATAFFDQFSLFLRQSLRAAAVAGAIVFIAGLLMGPGRVASGVRRVPVAAAAGIQRWLGSLGLTMDSVRDWVRGQANALRVGAALIAVLFIFMQRYKTPGLVVWTTVGLLVALFLIQILASDERPAAPEPVDGTGATTPLGA